MVEVFRVLLDGAAGKLQNPDLLGIDAAEVFPEEDRLDLALRVFGEVDALRVEELDQRHARIVRARGGYERRRRPASPRIPCRAIGSGMERMSSTLTPTESRPESMARFSMRATGPDSRLVTTVAPRFR